MPYQVPQPARKRDQYRCVTVLYDEFAQYCRTAEQLALTSYLYDGAKKQDRMQWEDYTPMGYLSNAPIRECEQLLKLTRSQRAHALRELKQQGSIEPMGYWQGDRDRYFRYGTAKYRVTEEYQLLKRTISFCRRSPNRQPDDACRTYTPIYGWMVNLSENFDQLVLLAFIVRKYRLRGTQQVTLSNRYIQTYTRLSYYAIRKGLEGLKNRGLIDIRLRHGEPRQIVILRPLQKLVEQHQDESMGRNPFHVVPMDIMTRRRGKIKPATNQAQREPIRFVKQTRAIESELYEQPPRTTVPLYHRRQ